ncbi:hypothetical protein AAE478_000491 [Parahypoxylon ruwenzoriense]
MPGFFVTSCLTRPMGARWRFLRRAGLKLKNLGQVFATSKTTSKSGHPMYSLQLAEPSGSIESIHSMESSIIEEPVNKVPKLQLSLDGLVKPREPEKRRISSTTTIASDLTWESTDNWETWGPPSPTDSEDDDDDDPFDSGFVKLGELRSPRRPLEFRGLKDPAKPEFKKKPSHGESKYSYGDVDFRPMPTITEVDEDKELPGYYVEEITICLAIYGRRNRTLRPPRGVAWAHSAANAETSSQNIAVEHLDSL